MQIVIQLFKKYLNSTHLTQISGACLVLTGFSLMNLAPSHAVANRVWGGELNRGSFNSAKETFKRQFNTQRAQENNTTQSYMETIHSAYVDGRGCFTFAKILFKSKLFARVFSSRKEQRKKGFEMLVYAGALGYEESHDLLLHLDRHASGPTPSAFRFSDRGYVFSDISEAFITDFGLDKKPSLREDRARFYSIYQDLYDRNGVSARTKTYAGQLLGGRLVLNDEPVYIHYSDEIPLSERIVIEQPTEQPSASSESKISEEERAEIDRMLDAIVIDEEDET